MVNHLFGDGRISTLHQALGGLARRQQALAGNLANVDTPGYQRRDVDFEGELRTQSGGSGAALAATQAGHMRAAPSSSGLLRSLVGEETPSETGRNDGNNVDVDYEMTRLAETSLRYQLLTQATSNRFMTLKEIASRIS